MYDFINDSRFENIEKLDPKKALLSSATPHMEEEIRYVKECYEKGWITTRGDNIDAVEHDIARYMSTDSARKYAVALTNGTAALHLAVKLAAERIYGSSTGISTPWGKGVGGSLYGKRVITV